MNGSKGVDERPILRALDAVKAENAHLREQVNVLRRQLTAAEREAAGLRTARDIALRVAVGR